MLQNPAAGNQALFNLAWLKNAFLDIRPRTLNVYIHVRPRELAEEGIGQHRDSRVGIDAANNKYLLDGYHHKMSLSERWTAIRNLRRHWLSVPGVQMVRVGYERFGMHDALEYFQERMRLENDSFEIVELAWPNEGPGSKYDRIQRLEPDFRNGRWYFAAVLEKESPNQAQMRAQGEDFRIWMPTKRMDENKRVYSLSGDYSRNSRSTRFPSTTTSWMRSRASTTPPIQYDERWLEPDNG